MATYFKDADGNYFPINSTIDKDGDTIFEEGVEVKFIDAVTWSDDLFNEIANSGSFVTTAYEVITTRYKKQYGEFEMEAPPKKCIASILNYMNELREDAVDRGDEEDSYYSEEAFTRGDIGI